MAVPTRWAAVALAALVAGAAGCSSGHAGDGSVEDAIARGLEVDRGDRALRFERAEAHCVADRVIAGLGEARLEDLGARRSPLDALALTPAEQRLVLGAVSGCTDLVGQVAGFLEGDGVVPPAVARCVAARYASAPELAEAMFGDEVDAEVARRIDELLDGALAACVAEA